MSRGLKQWDDWPQPLISHHPRARRMKLRVDPETGQAMVTLPKGIAIRTGHEFIARHAQWIDEQRARLVPRRLFADGVVLPVLGQPITVCHDPEFGRRLQLHENILTVGGPEDHVNRRVTEWLKRFVRDRLADSASDLAIAINRRVGAIRIGDPKSRWGSCSGRGTLSFSWRLVLAPEDVMEYVCAHEVAHLKHMDHSPAFWALVRKIYGDPASAQTWLKEHGRDLRGWG